MKTFQEFMVIVEGMTMDDFKKQRRRQKEEPPIRKRGGLSAPEDERSIGGEANRKNKDYWASVVGKNRDRGAGNKAKRRVDALKNEKRTVKEAGDWWHPDPEKDKKMPGRGPKLRAKEDRGQDTSAQTKPDYRNRLKPGESYMDFAKRKSRGESVEFEIEEGMTMKDFKQQRSRQKQKDKRAAEKTSPLRRAGIHADKASPERDARHRANVDPDFDGDDSVNYPGGKLKNPKKIRKAKALGELD